MRLPRVRFTIRRMMTVVAMLAVIIGGTQLWLRARRLSRSRKGFPIYGSLSCTA